MSGHSKWSQIKRQKGIEDQKRGQVFSKLSKLISIAARKGTDPEKNIELKNVVERARSFNMPKESIERALKRAAEKDLAELEELVVEAIGPGSINIIITAITDNKNRTMGELRNILSEFGYKIAQQGAVMWMFEKKDREFIPKYPIENLDENTRSNLEKLLEKLNGKEDIQEVCVNLP